MELNFSTPLVVIASLTFIIDCVIRIALLLYVPRGRKPTAAMSWLLAIFILPGLGIILFLIIGSTKLSKGRRARQHTVNTIIESLAKPEIEAIDALSAQAQERYKPLIDLCQAFGKLPLRSGNSMHFLTDYNDAILDITKRLRAAKHYVYIEYYIIALDETTQPFFAALEEAAGRGVQIYVLFDTFGSRKYKNYALMKQELTRIGVAWRAMLPLRLRIGQYNRPDLRNHRKIVVIDDDFAYIGSQNLIEETYERKDHISYDEFVVRMTGPVVGQCAAVFAGDWYSETGERLHEFTHLQRSLKAPKKVHAGVLAQVLPSGSGYQYENNLKLFVALMYTARKSIVITNPYFVPDEALLTAVISAVKRGVSVTLINSEAMDQWMVGHAQRSYYRELLKAGVQIYLYKAPKLLHSKHITIDDDIAVIGSSNMDIRSFELNSECVVVCYDKPTVTKLKKQQAIDLAKSKRISLKVWEKRGVRTELLDNIARLTAALQ